MPPGLPASPTAPLRPIFSSKDLLVLDKPSGVSVLADRTGAPCLWDEVKAHYPNARLVHRLDKGTSGVFLVALSAPCQRRLAQAFAKRQIRKHYLAVVAGRFPAGRSLAIALPLRRGRKSRYRVAGPRVEIRASRQGWHIDADGGFDATTRARALAASKHRSLLAIQPLTGRSHQIRVHLAWIGHAVVGDHLYGTPQAPEQAGPRLALHAHKLVVPGHGLFRAVPPDFEALLGKRLRQADAPRSS